MIIQAILDFFRDALVNWLSGVGSLVDAVGGTGTAAFVGSSVGDATHFLALFIGSVAWAALLSAFGAYVVLFLATGVIAIFTRRFTAS